MEKVSIITVTYNLIKEDRSAFFKQMISSIQNQTYKNIEHIIIDGASEDGTIDLIKSEIKDKNNVLLISEPDNGIYDAMNKGIDISTGNYIIFMFSDDYYVSNEAIEKLVSSIKKGNSDFVISNFKYITTKKEQVIYPRIEKFVARMPFGQNTMLCKRELYNKYNGYNSKYKIAADYDFILKIMLDNTKFSYVNEALTSFRDTGISSNNQKSKYIEVHNILKDQYAKYLSPETINRIHTKNASISSIWEISNSNLARNVKKNLYKYMKCNRWFFYLKLKKKTKIIRILGIYLMRIDSSLNNLK